MKKKIIVILLICAMALSCASCSVRETLLEGNGAVSEFAREINAVLEGRYSAEDSNSTNSKGDTADGKEDSSAHPSTAPEQAPEVPPVEEEEALAIEVLAIDRTPHVPFAEIWHKDIDFSEMEYSLYDSAEFMDACQALSCCEDIYEAIDIYNFLYDELVYIESQYVICHVQYSRDITNEQLQEDQVQCENIANECFDSFCAAVRDCLNGPVGPSFTVFLGEDAAQEYLEYEDMTEREAELAEEETRLIALYYEQMEEADSYTYYYNGKDWTMAMLQGFYGRYLTYDEWYMIYDGINAKVNAVVGETYLKLIAVRHEKAQLAGYDSYADYAYENIYARDYTTDDAQAFCDSVKAAVAGDFFNRVYTSPLLYNDFSFSAGADEMIGLLGEFSYALDERLGQAWEYFASHGLYTLSDDPVMRQGGFTTTISMYNSPYIHISLSGQLYDMGTLIHEFGHFSDAYWNRPNDIVLDSGCFDIFEIHSTGLEVIFQRFYPSIFGDQSVQAEYYSLLNMLYCVVDGCLYDEFQRTIYDNPDMTLDEINQLYYDLCIQYGQPQRTDVNYYWMNVHHNFEAPMYYISYAVSSLTALQIWDLQQEDPDAAFELYMEILGCGAYEYGYMELIDAVGLIRFSEEGAAGAICAPAIEYCANLG